MPDKKHNKNRQTQEKNETIQLQFALVWSS